MLHPFLASLSFCHTRYTICAVACKVRMCDIVIMGKRTSDKKTEFLSVRVPATTKAALIRLAETNERSLSWVVAKILETHLSQKSARRLR